MVVKSQIRKWLNRSKQWSGNYEFTMESPNIGSMLAILSMLELSSSWKSKDVLLLWEIIILGHYKLSLFGET